VYNVNKGENTLEESEILEPVHTALREILERQRLNKPVSGFTDHDVIAITLLYSMIMGDRLVDFLKEEKIGLSAAQLQSEYFAQVIQLTTQAMTQVNVKDYYKKKGE
jgi:hypothetical protein